MRLLEFEEEITVFHTTNESSLESMKAHGYMGLDFNDYMNLLRTVGEDVKKKFNDISDEKIAFFAKKSLECK